MRGAQAYDRLSRLTALLGLWGASTLGGRSLAIALVCLLVSAAGWSRVQPLTRTQRAGWRWANIGVSMLCLAGVLLEPAREDALTALLCWLVAHGAWAHHGARGGRINLLLTLLILSVASVVNHSVLILGLIAVVAALAPVLLLLSLLREETEDRGLASTQLGSSWRVLLLVPLQIGLVLSVLFFMPLEPSADLPEPMGSGQAGVPGALGLNEMGEITADQSIVLRAQVESDSGEAPTGPYYFPMERLDFYDAQTMRWSHAELSLEPGSSQPPEELTGLVRQEILLEPLAGGQLLALVDPVAIDVRGGTQVDSAGGWWGIEVGGLVSYTAWSRPDGPEAAMGGEVVRPSGVDAVVKEYALEWLREVPRATEREKAEHIARRLRESYQYEASPSQVLQEQTLVGFLQSSRRGHCTYFATTLALMLRYADIDSRVVRGFVGAETSPFDGMVIARRSDAHAWVEARIDGRWVTLDATPVAASVESMSVLEAAGEWVSGQWSELLWASRTVELGPLLQLSMGWLRRHAVALIIGLLIVLSGMMGLREGRAWWRRHQKESRRGRVAKRYDRARDLVRRRGWRIPPQLPPRQAARWLVEHAGSLAEPLETLAWLHYRVRYGGESDQTLLEEAETALGDLKVLPRRRRA